LKVGVTVAEGFVLATVRGALLSTKGLMGMEVVEAPTIWGRAFIKGVVAILALGTGFTCPMAGVVVGVEGAVELLNTALDEDEVVVTAVAEPSAIVAEVVFVAVNGKAEVGLTAVADLDEAGVVGQGVVLVVFKSNNVGFVVIGDGGGGALLKTGVDDNFVSTDIDLIMVADDAVEVAALSDNVEMVL
jgi:hypothetical protein